MAVSNTNVKSQYAADGSEDTFVIGFDYEKHLASAQVQVFLVDYDGAETLQVIGALNDYILDPPYDAVTNPGGPVSVVFNTPPDDTDWEFIRIRRATPYTQTTGYTNNGPFPAKSHEKALDRIVFQIQQVADVASRALVLGEAGANAIPPLVASSVLATNPDADGFAWIPIENIAGAPAGGLTGDVLVKASDADLDLTWQPFVYDGFSSRFGQSVSFQTLKEAMDYIIAITYTAPLITLSASGNVLREKGAAVTSTTLTAAITKRSDPIDEVRFYLNPSTLLDTQTTGGAIPSGGNSTYNWTGSFSDNTTFRAEVDDNGATGGPTTVSSTTTFSFVYPYYRGAGAVGLSAASVAGLTKEVIASTANKVVSFSAANGDVFYFAYPASYGALTSILDVNNFETLPDWTLRTENITGLDGNAVSYRIYEFNNPVTAGSYQYTFKR